MNQGNLIEVTGDDLGQVRLRGKGDICILKICALFGPDPKEVAQRQEMDRQLNLSTAKWSQAGEVLEPFSEYRLTISTAIDAYGEGELSGTSDQHLKQSENVYFRTEGPPGLTNLSLPIGRADYRVGTIAVTTGLPTVTGNGTSWGEPLAGATLQVEGDSTPYLISKINSATSLVLKQPYQGANNNQAKYAISNFDAGLGDLTRYVRQTIPVTVPAVGQKPVMAKPFYRAYDIGVDFNENYVDLMYRISGRDLGLYLYDSNNRPVRDAEGKLLVQSGDWGEVEELTLTTGDQRWIALSNTLGPCVLPIKQENLMQDKKLTSAIAGRVLEPDAIYEARLIPLLLREGFRSYALAAMAQGPSGKLGRWLIRDEGNINAPSTWVVGEAGIPPGRYLTQTSNIKGGSDDASDPVKPGTMLLFGNDPALEPSHKEQPAGWTDYRLSVYLRSAGDGAIGVVFRYRDANNYYRLSLDRKRKFRRLVRVANGAHTILKQDDFTYEQQLDYLITIEAIGSGLRVYQDGALVFDVTDATHTQGCIGLYCYENPGARFSDVSVHDFRQTAPAVYRFQYTTSLFANFFHHLHSYQDETWRAAIAGVASARPALNKAVKPTVPPTDDEARAYETLATAVLKQAARQNPREVQVTRVEIDPESHCRGRDSPLNDRNCRAK